MHGLLIQILGFFRQPTDKTDIPRITTLGLREALAAGEPLVVLDVRDAGDFGGAPGHIPGARNIPLPELGERVEEVRSWGQPVAVVCRTEPRARKAVALLSAAGIGPVHLVTGGVRQWREEGGALASDALPPGNRDGS